MDKQQVSELVSNKLKLIRTEAGYTQERMAEVVGISKKTLVQIEKGRVEANWTHVIAVCALFRNSEILQATFGNDPLEIIETLAHSSVSSPREKTMGGKVWWSDCIEKNEFRVQQNLISHHFRIIDKDDYRWFSSFDKEETIERLEELIKYKM